MAYSRKADALVESFKQFRLPYDPYLIVETIRKNADEGSMSHLFADLIESLQDQINELKINLSRAEKRSTKKRKG